MWTYQFFKIDTYITNTNFDLYVCYMNKTNLN